MKIVKEGYVLYLMDSGAPSPDGKPRPPVEGYFNDRRFEFQNTSIPRCCPVLTNEAKVYSSFSFAYRSGEKWQRVCPYVKHFTAEQVGITDTGEVVLIDPEIVAKMKARTPFDFPIETGENGVGAVKAPADVFRDRGKLRTLPNGKPAFMYPIGYLAATLGRTSLTIRQWEISGLLPDSGFRDTNGARLYTRDQVSVVVSAAERAQLSRRKPAKHTHFRRWVHKGFERLREEYERKE